MAQILDHHGGQSGAERPGRTGREGKTLEKQGGLRKQESPGPSAPPHAASFLSPVRHPQAVPPRGAGASRTRFGHPPAFPEWLLQPRPAAGEFLEG